MANCGIHRIEKRKTADVSKLQHEANRTVNDRDHDFSASDIDWKRTTENVRLVNSNNWLKDIKQKITEGGIEKYRKDAVVMLDGLYTASPEFFKEYTEAYREVKEEKKAATSAETISRLIAKLDRERAKCMKYFKDCLEFHRRNYGIIINAVVHFDEATPHMQVASVPLVKDNNGKVRLSAKDIMGGRSEYRDKQNRFYEEVTSKYGLERGELKEDAKEKKKHLTVQDYKIKKKDELIEELAQKNAKLMSKNAKLINKINDLIDYHNALNDEIDTMEIDREREMNR